VKVKIPEFEAVWPLIDQTKVEEALWSPKRDGRKPTYSLDEVNNIYEMLENACRHWLPRDLVELKIEEVEGLYQDEIGIKGYIDVLGTMNGTIKPFDAYKNKRIIIDWKTRDGELDQRWRDRLIDSWQWKIYASLTGASVISYRGVSSRCYDDGCATKEILLGVHDTCVKETFDYIRGVQLQRQALVNVGMDIWPRNMPDACFKYSYECPFKYDCDHYTMPRYVPKSDREMSYTSLGQFQRCPEFARRMENAPEADDTDTSNKGDAFHKCIAEVYRQASKIKVY